MIAGGAGFNIYFQLKPALQRRENLLNVPCRLDSKL